MEKRGQRQTWSLHNAESDTVVRTLESSEKARSILRALGGCSGIGQVAQDSVEGRPVITAQTTSPWW